MGLAWVWMPAHTIHAPGVLHDCVGYAHMLSLFPLSCTQDSHICSRCTAFLWESGDPIAAISLGKRPYLDFWFSLFLLATRVSTQEPSS